MLRLSAVTLALAFTGLVHSLPYSSGTTESFTNQTSTPTPIYPSTADGSEWPDSFTFATPSPSGLNSNHNISEHRGSHGAEHSIVTVTVDCASASMFTNIPVATGMDTDNATGSLGLPTASPSDGDIPGGFISTFSDASGPVATPSDSAALPSESPLVPSSTSEFSEPVITSSSISDVASATSDIPEPVITNSIPDAASSSDSFTNEPEIASSVSLVSDTPLPTSTTTLGAREDQGNSATISEAVSFTNIPSSVPIQRESGSPGVPYLIRQSGIPLQSAIPVSSAFMSGWKSQARPSGMSFGGYGMKNGSPGAPEGENGPRTVMVCAPSLPSSA